MLFVILNKCILCLCVGSCFRTLAVILVSDFFSPYLISLVYVRIWPCMLPGIRKVLCGSFLRAIYKFSFIHSLISTFPVDSTSFLPISLYFPLRGVPWAQKMRSKNQLLSKFLLYEGLERVRVYLASHGLSAADTFTIQKFLPTWFIQIMPTRSLSVKLYDLKKRRKKKKSN